MDMSDGREFGVLIGKIDGMCDSLQEVRADVKCLLQNKATTEERLLNGNKKFAEQDRRMECVEKRRCPRFNYGLIITVIAVGFTVLGFVVRVN